MTVNKLSTLVRNIYITKYPRTNEDCMWSYTIRNVTNTHLPFPNNSEKSCACKNAKQNERKGEERRITKKK